MKSATTLILALALLLLAGCSQKPTSYPSDTPRVSREMQQWPQDPTCFPGCGPGSTPW